MSYRILFVIESLFPLGAAQQLKLLADSLVDRQHEIHVAVLGQRTFEPTQWTEKNIKVYFLNGDDQTPLHTMRDGYFVVKQLRQLIQKIQPEIVHSWCGRSELLTLMATADIPLVENLKRLRLFSTELFLQPEKRFTRKAIEDRLGKRVERMIVPHISVQDHLADNGYREPLISIVPNATPIPESGVDRIQARKKILQQLGLPDSSYLAGTVAPLRHRTRLKDLVWATDLLSRIRDDFHFLVVGTGTQLRQLKRFAALTKSKAHIHFLGHPESPEQVVSGLDFYWHSHLRDPLSGNVLAAMSQGIPVVSVYGPGTTEIIRHQETAFGVNFGARDEFARWTKFLIEKPDALQQLSNQGRSFARKNFEVSTMTDGYLSIYDLEN